MALGAFSFAFLVYDDLAIVLAFVAVVRFGIKFCVLDIFIDKSDHGFEGLNVFLHIGNLDVGDGASGRDLLELGLEGEFGEGVDGFSHVDMVRIGIVAFVGDVGDRSEFFFIDLGEAVAE